MVTGLEHPWAMAWLPNGDILVTERAGRLRTIRAGKLLPEALAGLEKVSNVEADQLFATKQGGLLDLALHPKFQENRLIYFSYAQGTKEANRTQVARAKLEDGKLSDWEVIFKNDNTKMGGQHFGSRLLWLDDETLLVSIGDGGNPPVKFEGEYIRNQAQNLKTHFGKVVRLSANGEPPTDNPFTAEHSATKDIFSLGHRNIQGLAYDEATKTIWATEHGARGGDELNRIVAGKNYGWSEVSYSREYVSFLPVADKTSAPGMEQPSRVWTPSIAPSGLAVYRHERFPEWQGNLFAGGLVSKTIRRLVLNNEGRVKKETKLVIDARVRDVRVGPDGYLYVLTDEENGKLLKITSLK